MRVSMICCPFQTSFGFYGSALTAAIEKRTGIPVQWVASNCGCGDPSEANRRYEAKKCDYFEMPVPGEFRSKHEWKRRVRSMARTVVFSVRARRFSSLSAGAEVVHFQQVLNAYGSKTVFAWLKSPSNAVKVVTVHELDSEQTESKASNLAYNRANAIIVHTQEMKDELVRLKVNPDKIHIVLNGTVIPEPSNAPRNGIVFYGGHKLMTNKGLGTLMRAMEIIQARMGDQTPTLSVHGHYAIETPKAAVELATRHGVERRINWLNQIPEEEVVRLYQRSSVCVLPYTGSFAGGAAGLAAACGLPVVCTRKAGLPDHLGDCGVWIAESNADQLADRITELLCDEGLRQKVAARSFQRAQDALRWDIIADETLKIYRGATEDRRAA